MLLALGLFLLVAPIFVLGYRAWLGWLLSQARSGAPPGLAFHPRLPADFGWGNVVDELFVTALPEEFFYRGWLQARLKRVWPGGAHLAGVVVGPAFLLTAALFAVGHLAIFQASRLAVFFPALCSSAGCASGPGPWWAAPSSTPPATSWRRWWPPRSTRSGTPAS